MVQTDHCTVLYTLYTQCTLYTQSTVHCWVSKVTAVAVACKYYPHCSVPARRLNSPGVTHSPHNTKVRLSCNVLQYFHVFLKALVAISVRGLEHKGASVLSLNIPERSRPFAFLQKEVK